MESESAPDFEACVRELAADRIHGASELARMALGIAARWAEDCPADCTEEVLRKLQRLAEQLMASRPSMAPVINLVGTWRASLVDLRERPLEDFRLEAAHAARECSERSLTAVQETARHAASLIARDATVVTHSLSSTIVEVFRQIREHPVKAIVSESRPGLEGHRLATLLSEWRIPVTLITDAEIGHFTGRADLALVGADSVLLDGAVINKIGTSLLALAAHEYHVPFYVCAESFKRRADPPSEIELEESDPAELGAPLLPGITAANVTFDLTPAHLVTAWIDELGVSSTLPSVTT